MSVNFEDPQSLLTQSSRYGLQFAMFLPILPLFNGKWNLDATLLWGKKRKSEKSMLLSNMTGLQSHYQLKGLWKSTTEEMFEQRFAEKEWGWTLSDGEASPSLRVHPHSFSAKRCSNISSVVDFHNPLSW